MNTLVLLFVVSMPRPDCVSRWDQTAATAAQLGMAPATARPERRVDLLFFAPGETPTVQLTPAQEACFETLVYRVSGKPEPASKYAPKPAPKAAKP